MVETALAPAQEATDAVGSPDDAPSAPLHVASLHVTESANLDPFLTASYEGRLLARDAEPLVFQPVPAEACAFHAEVRPGLAGRAVLAPCWGPLTLDGKAVAGTHRVDGVPCCRHHQLAQRLGGDRARLAAAAASACEEGLVPPLVAARIDRSAALFLRARFGPLRTSGVDGLDGGGHRVSVLEDGRARVATWVELEPTGPDDVPQRRSVELLLELDDGPDGDALLRLRVLDDDAAQRVSVAPDPTTPSTR